MKVKDITARDIWIARSRIAPYVTKTPLVYSHTLSEMTGANIYLKLENLQEIGAFKVRGAANKILSLPEGSRRPVSPPSPPETTALPSPISPASWAFLRSSVCPVMFRR